MIIKFDIVKTRLGATSIRNLATGEIMHNPLGPERESHDLYIVFSNFAERITRPIKSPLVVFDVGLGAAANSLAALECWRKNKVNARPLHIVSFEKDLSLLAF